MKRFLFILVMAVLAAPSDAAVRKPHLQRPVYDGHFTVTVDGSLPRGTPGTLRLVSAAGVTGEPDVAPNGGHVSTSVTCTPGEGSYLFEAQLSYTTRKGEKVLTTFAFFPCR